MGWTMRRLRRAMFNHAAQPTLRTCWPSSTRPRRPTDGVQFSGFVIGSRLVGVMGIQQRHNADLIRHAYVRPGYQGRGVGSRLLRHLCSITKRPVLIGTWSAATWAVRFYERHGFAPVADGDVAPLLRTYWNVPEQQVDASVVLASPRLTSSAVDLLIARTSAADHASTA